MQEVKFEITDYGKEVVRECILTKKQLLLTQYKIGSSYDYEPLPSQTDIYGTTLLTEFSKNALPMSMTRANQDKIVLTIVLNQYVGPFTFGEAGIFFENKLFAILVYKLPIEKTINGSYNDVVSINFIIQFENIGSLTSVDITNHFLHDLPSVLTEEQLPPYDNSISNTYIIENYKNTGFYAVAVWNTTTNAWQFITSNLVFKPKCVVGTDEKGELIELEEFSVDNYLVLDANGNLNFNLH